MNIASRLGGGHHTNPARRIAIALAGLAAVVIYGTGGYMVVEHYNLLDAAFMTVITMTTVGYEEVHPLDGSGRIFTITVIVLGVISFFYVFGVVVELFSSGQWQRYRRTRRLNSHIEMLHDHVIICGYGRTGRQVARELAQRSVAFVVVEQNADGLANVDADAVPHIVGDASSDEVLQKAGVARARALVSAVDSDERNVYIVLTARALNPDLSIVARSALSATIPKLERAGADRVVSPYTLSGRRMAALALQPAVMDTVDLVTAGAADLRLEELVVGRDDGARMTAGDLRRSGAVLLATRTGDGELHVNPDDADTLTPNDIVVAVGTPEQLEELASRLRPARGAEVSGF